MSAIMCDVIEGTVTPVVANATSKAGNNLLKIVEMRLKYGNAQNGRRKDLLLTCDLQ